MAYTTKNSIPVGNGAMDSATDLSDKAGYSCIPSSTTVAIGAAGTGFAQLTDGGQDASGQKVGVHIGHVTGKIGAAVSRLAFVRSDANGLWIESPSGQPACGVFLSSGSASGQEVHLKLWGGYIYTVP
jgi:hypothetical protein